MNTKAAILQCLQEGHIGREKAIHSEELEEKLGVSGRTVRRSVSALRQEGYPVCSDETGYYYADNQQEINSTVDWLSELVKKVSNARTGLLYAPVPNQAETYEVTITIRKGEHHAE